MRRSKPAAALIVMIAVATAIGCSVAPEDPLVIPDSPDGSVRVVIDGLAQHHPEVVWRALPPSYQADVHALAANFAENMDPAIFDRAVAVARKGTAVLQSKKELVLATETVRQSGVDVEAVDTAWEGGILFLDTFLASDLARLETYADLDAEKFLETTGRQLMEHLLAFTAGGGGDDNLAARLPAWEGAEIEPLSKRGEEAVVRISVAGEEPVELAMVRVEGRWLPAELVREWPGMVETARSRIEFLASDDAAQLKVQVLFAIGVAEGFIDQVDTMEIPEDLDNLIGGILGHFVQVAETSSEA